jgi:hypothetical protein
MAPKATTSPGPSCLGRSKTVRFSRHAARHSLDEQLGLRRALDPMLGCAAGKGRILLVAEPYVDLPAHIAPPLPGEMLAAGTAPVP